MSKREILAIIKASAQAGAWQEGVTVEEICEFCDKEIAALDRKAAKAKEKAAEKRAKGDEMTAALKAALTDELTVIADIVAKVDFPDVTAQKASVRLNQLFKNGEAVKEEISVSAEGQKARKLIAYKLA